MDRKLLALAVAGACVAPAAWAQSEDPVTLYGRVYVTVESVEAKGDAGVANAAGACVSPSCVPAVSRRTRVSDQFSYLGVRGTESLGGDLKAFFQLETQFKADQNDTTFAARNSGVGLKGGWGQILVGRWDTPFKKTNGDVDPFDDLTIGGFITAMQGSGIGNVNGQFDRRDQNVIQYWSPKFAGFELRLSYSANEAKTDTTNPLSQGGSIPWANGPFYVGYAYHELKDLTFGVYTNGAAAPPPVLAVGSITVGKQTANAIFGTWTVGPVKLGVDYQEFKRTSPFLPAAITPSTVVGFDKQKAMLANIVWTLGANKFIYQYAKTKDGGQHNSDPATTPQSPQCDSNAVGWQYNFSKRTFVLAQYVWIKNNATATCNFGSNALSIAPGQDPEGFALGLRTVF